VVVKLLVRLRTVSLLVLVMISIPSFARDSIDYATMWQGHWRWSVSANKVEAGPVRDSGGELTINQCKKNRCAYAIPSTGDESSVCSAEGIIQLLSNTNATAYPTDEGGPNKRCILTFMQKNGRINIDSKGSECSDFCGHSGPDFGTDYIRVKKQNEKR
jgi:hypothetical protein